MAGEKEIEKRRRILRARGVPEAFIDNIATRRDNHLDQAMQVVVGSVAALILPALYLFRRSLVDDILVSVLYGGVARNWMFGVHVSYYLVLFCSWFYLTYLGFVVISFAIYLLGPSVRPYPAYSGGATTLRRLNDEESLETLKPNPRYQALAHLDSDQAFLEALRKPRLEKGHIWWLTALVGLIVICHFDYWTLRGHEITLHRPWGSRTYDLRQAKYAAVDCREGEDDNQFEYGIYFPHKRFELGMRRDVVNRLAEPQVFARIERVDAFLVQAGIPVYRAKRTAKSVEVDGPCHTVWADPMGPDGTARFDRLLYEAAPAK